MEKYIKDFLKIIRHNIKTIIKGDFDEGITDLNTLCNSALMRIDRKSVTPDVKNIPKLSEHQIRQLRNFYSPFVAFMTDRYHRLYTYKSGKFYPEYLPEDFYVMYADRFFSDRNEARYIDNKCYYYRIFSNVRQPELVAMRIGKTWLDENLRAVSPKVIISLLKKEREVVIKKAVNSQGGYGVFFLNGNNMIYDFRKIIRNISGDVVIQRPVHQHPLLAQLHPESVNTMRIVSLLTGNHVKIYAVALKIGTGNSRTDNGCQGGIYVGVNPDSSLKEYGILDDGTVLHCHPDLDYFFADKKVPCLSSALELVKNAHVFMGHFRLVSWDVTIDDKGKAVLIEANLSLGGINDVQMCCGPLFGKDTKKILREVMQDRRKVTTLL